MNKFQGLIVHKLSHVAIKKKKHSRNISSKYQDSTFVDLHPL